MSSTHGGLSSSTLPQMLRNLRKGGMQRMIAMIVICVATLAVTGLVWYLERREHRLGNRLEDTPTRDSEQEENQSTKENT
ncbi:hypothetical protein HHX47_DHR5000196 [Lentinula edodes]|nr:hypothetical protein HHX47_DHR5000196 [Lentinula edodes]